MKSPLADETSDLLAQARGGDIDAFSHLMEMEQPRLLAQAQVFCGNWHLAQDLVQESMIEAWRSLHRFDGSCRLFTWLYVILLRRHRRSLSWFSRRLPLATTGCQLEEDPTGPTVDPVTNSDEVLESELLQAMLQAPPSRDGKVKTKNLDPDRVAAAAVALWQQ